MKEADKTTRLVNHIIDTIVVMVFIILNAFLLDGLLHIIPEEGSPWLALYFIAIYVGYHFIMEYRYGQTIGKFITRSKVTDMTGNKPVAQALIIRNISRLIPCDNLSFLFGKSGWHDSISETQVVIV